jgi:hypothetical protein
MKCDKHTMLMVYIVKFKLIVLILITIFQCNLNAYECEYVKVKNIGHRGVVIFENQYRIKLNNVITYMDIVNLNNDELKKIDIAFKKFISTLNPMDPKNPEILLEVLLKNGFVYMYYPSKAQYDDILFKKNISSMKKAKDQQLNIWKYLNNKQQIELLSDKSCFYIIEADIYNNRETILYDTSHYWNFYNTSVKNLFIGFKNNDSIKKTGKFLITGCINMIHDSNNVYIKLYNNNNIIDLNENYLD